MRYQIQIISEDEELCIVRPNDKVLGLLLLYAVETAEGVQEDGSSNPENDEVRILCNKIIDFMKNAWKESISPKCVVCNRVMTPLEMLAASITNGKCGFCVSDNSL